jgi:K+-transporting ATPase c subunit
MLGIIVPGLRTSLVAWLLCGIAYPLVLTGLGQWLMPFQANGRGREGRWDDPRLSAYRAAMERA